MASGYIVQTVGQAPTYTSGGSHTFATMSNGSPTVGTEQFGMNLVSDPGLSTGYNVAQEPDSTFGYGLPAPSSANGGLRGYDTANTYSYQNGDEIAYSNSSSGITCYFPTYIYNISSTTPAGQYTFNQDIVATGTF